MVNSSSAISGAMLLQRYIRTATRTVKAAIMTETQMQQMHSLRRLPDIGGSGNSKTQAAGLPS